MWLSVELDGISAEGDEFAGGREVRSKSKEKNEKQKLPNSLNTFPKAAETAKITTKPSMPPWR